jgi:AbrB family looped-hinge helix DNA binding protein
MTAVTVDAKGRLAIPIEMRKAFGIGAGDILFIEADAEHGMLHLAKALNPFDGLAEYAIQEYHAGRTRGLRDYAADRGIDLDATE